MPAVVFGARCSQAAIFSLSFGTRSNWRFLQRLSLQNDGFARRIYEAGDAAQQLQDFYQEIASPLLANVTFNYVTAKVGIAPSVAK